MEGLQSDNNSGKLQYSLNGLSNNTNTHIRSSSFGRLTEALNINTKRKSSI